jgi:hypothetical protein
MKPVKRPDGWWITENDDGEDYGPYGTKVEAEDDIRGLKRYDKYGHLRSFWTTDKRR